MTSKAETTPTQYRVVWQHVTALNPSMAGLIPGRSAANGMMVSYGYGAILPANTPPDTIARLLGKGAIEAVV
jgi:hypothetical protein